MRESALTSEVKERGDLLLEGGVGRQHDVGSGPDQLGIVTGLVAGGAVEDLQGSTGPELETAQGQIIADSGDVVVVVLNLIDQLATAGLDDHLYDLGLDPPARLAQIHDAVLDGLDQHVQLDPEEAPGCALCDLTYLGHDAPVSVAAGNCGQEGSEVIREVHDAHVLLPSSRPRAARCGGAPGSRAGCGGRG